MARVGFDPETGQLSYSVEDCRRSIDTILMTELGERVQRRLFGTIHERMIDRPQNEETIIDIYAGIAEAIEPRVVEGRQYGEPGFVLVRIGLDASTPGAVVALLSGAFFENGHLGDYSNPVALTLSYDLSRLAIGE